MSLDEQPGPGEHWSHKFAIWGGTGNPKLTPDCQKLIKKNADGRVILQNFIKLLLA